MTETTAVLMRRTFETAVTASEGDGRTIDARIVPYNVPATVVDLPPAGDGMPYQEEFAPGAFERQLRAADRVKVWLNFEHEIGLRGIVGHGTALHDEEDGLYGTFRVHENADGDKALAMVRDGLTPSLSLEFLALRTRIVDGVARRLRVHLDRVSLVRSGAYAGAEVLAVRMEPPVLTVERPPAFDPKLAEELEALGLEVPARLR